MQAIKTTISGTAVVGVALAAALVLASAPAASPRTTARPTLTEPAARTIAPDKTEAARGLWSQVSGGKGSTTIPARMLGIEAYRPDAARGSRVRVVIESRSPAQARAAVLAAGGRVERSARGLVQALVAPAAVAALSERPGVARVRAPYTRIETAVSGEEVAAALASSWHQKGFTGKGVKVAIVDGGFAGLADRQAAGELPANVVTQDFCGGELNTSDDHGTAVAEIVHEMAPDAQLYLICVGTEVDFATAVGYVKSQGVSVVNQSMGWEGDFRNDGSGLIGSAVADARANGILWVNAAGNEAMSHWSGTYDPVGPPIHKWSPSGDIGNTFLWPNGGSICGFMKWDEWPGGLRLRPRPRTVGLEPADRHLRGGAGLRRTAVRGDLPPPDERTGSERLLGDRRVPRRLVAASRPRQLEPAARVLRRGRQHRGARVLARRVRGWGSVLAVALARAVQLAGSDDRRSRKAGHRRPRQRVGGHLRRIRDLPVRFRRDVGVLSRGDRCRRTREAGVSHVHARPDQGVPHGGRA